MLEKNLLIYTFILLFPWTPAPRDQIPSSASMSINTHATLNHTNTHRYTEIIKINLKIKKKHFGDYNTITAFLPSQNKRKCRGSQNKLLDFRDGFLEKEYMWIRRVFPSRMY